MENLSVKIKKRIIDAFVVLLIFSAVIFIYLYATNNYIIIRFDELGALTKNMAVYYNGFKVGKIVDIEPDADFKHTVAKVNLIRKKINLPQNATVKVESFPSGELYLQFVYPQSPSLKMLKRGDVLEGIAKYSIEEFMIGQNVSGISDVVSLHVIKALKATEIANQEMQAFFKNTSGVIEQNSKGIKQSVDNVEAMTKNLAQMAKNLNQASGKLNNSLDEVDLKNTTKNVKDMTSDIKTTTENLALATKDMDKTMKKLDETISQANAVAHNLNDISGGIKETLSQRFSGMRIIFGTALKHNESCKNACKN